MQSLNRLFFIAAVSLLLIPTKTFAAKGAGGNFGAGFMLGSPSSLNVKYFQNSKIAFDAGLAFDSNDYVMLYGDYLVHFPGLFKTQSAFINSLNPYVGFGGFMAFSDHDHDHAPGQRHDHDLFGDDDEDFAFGVRVPIGVEWRATEIPLGVSLEIAPGIAVLPDTDSFIAAGIGLRYYF